MKRIFTFIIILFTTASAMAQMGGSTGVVGRISGIVIDSLTKKPMDYASVSIYRSGGRVPSNGVLTDEKGSFKLNEVKSGKWKIVVSFIGYPSKTIDPVITTPEKPDFNMGTIVIAQSGKALKAIEVSATKSVIETKIDKIVYNAEKDITSTGGNATDVMRKVPLVSVDINGNVSLRGDQNVRVLINGKPSGAMANNLADVLKSIPADQIKSVEVITSPSAKYDAEGGAGILNIITKSKNVSGISGSVSGGVGTRQNNGNANLNINQNRLSITGNFGGNFSWPQTTATESGTDILATQYSTRATSSSTVKRYGYRGSASLNYDFNNYNSFSSSIAVNQGGFNINSHSTSRIDSLAKTTFVPGTLNYLAQAHTETTLGGFDWSNDYVRKFKKEGHQIDIAAQWTHGITDFNSVSLYTTKKFNDLRSVNNGTNNEYTFQADYTNPVTDKFKIEAGGKTIIRPLESLYNNYLGYSNDVDLTADPNAFAYDPKSSNNYNYHQNVYAGYTVLTFTLPKNYGLQLGARVENTQIDGSPTSSSSTTPSINNGYTIFIPTMIFSKTVGNATYKLSYTKRIQRPSLTYLNPFLNTSNSTAFSVGNPALSPEISHYAELNYSTFIGASVINLSAYYKHTSDLIESIVNPYIPDPTKTLTSYQNIGTNNSFGASFFGSLNPIKIVTIRGSVNAYTYNPSAGASFSSDQTQNSTYINYNAFLSGSVNLKNGFAAESFVILNSPRRTIQGTNPAFSLWIIGVKKEFWDKKASLGLNTFNPFAENIAFNTKITGKAVNQFSNTSVPFRSFGISFSYAFGKVKFADPNDPTQKKKKGVNNDDLKQGESSGPGR